MYRLARKALRNGPIKKFLFRTRMNLNSQKCGIISQQVNFQQGYMKATCKVYFILSNLNGFHVIYT